MTKLWDFECSSCSKRKEAWVNDVDMSIPCECGGAMLRVMGGKPVFHASADVQPADDGTSYIEDKRGRTWHEHPVAERDMGNGYTQTLSIIHHADKVGGDA